jgi:hypothetical protein
MQHCHPRPEHNLHHLGPITNIHEAMVIGNGQLAAMITVAHDVVSFHLGKHDIYDARCEDVMADHVIPQDDLIRYQREYGFHWEGHAGATGREPHWDRKPDGVTLTEHSPIFDKQGAPCPKPAGQFRIFVAGSSASRIETQLDIATGLWRCEYTFPQVSGRLTIEAVIDRGANVLHVHTRSTGVVPGLTFELVKPADTVDSDLPRPVARIDSGDVASVTQVIPAAYDVPEFRWSLAAAMAGASKPWHARAFGADMQHAPADNIVADCAVALTTSRDGEGDTADRAVAMARTWRSNGFDLTREHTTASWAAFWQTSGIAIDDAELEAQWYRNLFALGCHIRGDAPGMALCANVPTVDRGPWHGVYTVNMNIQKMYLASLPTGHIDWLDSYARWLRDMRPTLEHTARLIFGFDDAVYSQHMLFPYVPAHRQPTSLVAGRSLGMTPWHGQPLWWHWQTTRDAAWLRDNAYWYLREAANFCAGFIEKYVGDDGVIGPSMNLECPGMLKDFAGNRNCIVDLIMFPQGLTWAIEAAKVLGVDADLRERWAVARKRVSPIPAGWDEQGRAWIAIDERDTKTPPRRALEGRAHGQAMWSAWACFPGEMVVGDEVDGLAPIIRDNLINMHPSERHPDFTWVHLWWCAIPGLRLGLPNAYEHAREIILRERWPSGQAKTTAWIVLLPHSWRAPEDNYLGVVGTTEMLLQSQGEVLRLLPAWPLEKAAAFNHLRARGGFDVSAEWSPATRTLQLLINALAENRCELRLPATVGRATMLVRGMTRPLRVDEHRVTFDALPGEPYELTLVLSA